MRILYTIILFLAVQLFAKPPNVLFLAVDDLRPELKSFGVEHIHSPNIDRLAEKGRAFHRHYVNAPSCGPSRYTLLTGLYGDQAPGNQALFERASRMKDAPETVPPSMPEWFRANGYTTVSVGKVSHHPGGWGGGNWADKSRPEMPGAWDRQLMPCGAWEYPSRAMHGLANGQSRQRGKMKAYESAAGPDTIYPDGLIADEGLVQLKELAAADTPFFLAIGLIRPHLPFGAPEAYMAPYKEVALPPTPHPGKPTWRTTWHGSGEFSRQYDHSGRDPNSDAGYADLLRRHYAACVTYADKHVGEILDALKEAGAEQNTVVVLWGDHGWHLGEHAIWGKHCLFEEALRSPLIISTPNLEAPGVKADAIVSSLDIFPTLCDLTGLELPTFANGRSLRPQLEDPEAIGHLAVSYWGRAKTIRTDAHRLILHHDGYAELYDHRTVEKETKNLAKEKPELVQKLSKQLKAELASP